ncbi:hypothetical protein CBR_g8507 [Chara braunii]|uniref:Myb/SANT-like DNA-binding domain-containing protein n=1 Tax=Chara braunii TaxID=69332 RepID=A0A388KMB8_CHABU|nr:hypothetical protein CBR_g8507 [Chara braunii]|eukprot:GBG71204.1 hypothetical protein CBR_g8507 [Chara braunii]
MHQSSTGRGVGSSAGSSAADKTRDRRCVQSKSMPTTCPEVVRPQRVQLPSPLSGGLVTGRRSVVSVADATFAQDVDERTGSHVWAEHRQELHLDDEDEEDEDVAVEIKPPGKRSMGGRGTSKKASAPHGRRTEKSVSVGSDGEGDVDVDGGRNFWSVDHMVTLVRAKWDQDAHMEGMGHAFACMKPREWKWQDVHERLKKVGIARNPENCGKKWDNLMQQFKKVHRFMHESGKPDYFQLKGKERRSHIFNFVMERAVYEEIKGPTAKNHTIHPRNVIDTGAPSGVEMSSGSGGKRGDGDCAGGGGG